MRQILQDLVSGETRLAEVPASQCGPGRVLIQAATSLVSIGTEKMLLEFAKAGWIEKARHQPERFHQVLDKIRTDGVIPTIQAVRAKLSQTVPLGYCNAGTVLEVGAGVRAGEFMVGDRVVCNGPHAELVCVPHHLCARIPSEVSDEEAVFAVVGAIALQGIRLAAPTLGEKFLVIGLGLIGLLTVQLLRANGCEVLGSDIRADRLRLAEQFGASVLNATQADLVGTALSWTRGLGVDGVIIAASAQSDDLIRQAARACRKRGRIILVGVVGLNLARDDFYKKELIFQVSCSYGPGRYDESYEQGGLDYPLAYVRWTEQRNFEAVLDAIRRRCLQVAPLITHRIGIEQGPSAYDIIQHDPLALGVIIEYPAKVEKTTVLTVAPGKTDGARAPRPTANAPPRVGVIGGGNYARSVLLPALARTPARLGCLVDLSPVAAAELARKFQFEAAATDYRAVLDDPDTEAVFILTDHAAHARLACEALAVGKHVFVEKPLCLSEAELAEVSAAYYRAEQARGLASLLLMVGFNRRFSSHTRRLKELLADRLEPLCLAMTINAGPIAPDHWLHDIRRGGGRIVGEACHFIDLLSYVVASPIERVSAIMAGGRLAVHSDKMSLQLSFADGSIGSINYFANGSARYPKETLEVFSEGRIVRLENFRVTRAFGCRLCRKFRTWRQDKGHQAELAAFISQIGRGGEEAAPLIPFNELENVTRASFAAMESAISGKSIRL